MAKVDLDGDHVHVITTTPESIRSIFDGGDIYEALSGLETTLDQAQGDVFTGETPVSYIVIEIRK